MAILVDLQYACKKKNTPVRSDIEKWLASTLDDQYENAELTIRIVDEKEATELNQQFRNKPGPANVLSFPAEDTDGLVPGLLGDIVICAPVVEKEAKQQDKPLLAHWAHMIIHGALHLTGYDHTNENDAMRMEEREIRILEKLGYRNPYD